MIYTVTFNPSIDYIATVNDFLVGRVNRTDNELFFAGGKGINVSIVLKNLGLKSIALGFRAGFIGDEIVKRLLEMGVSSDFVSVSKGISRINVKLRGMEETEVNGQGPAIEKEDIDKLYKQLDSLKAGDILVLAGSIPSVMPKDSYSEICKFLKDKNVDIVVDATKDLLMNVLPYHPFLIKPNNHELAELFNTEFHSNDDIIAHAKKLREMGARNVLVSMAGDGAILVTENDEVYISEAPKGQVKNSVGAGDSMVAGFIYGFGLDGSYEDAFKWGLCTGSASAFSDELAKKEAVEELIKKQTIKKL